MAFKIVVDSSANLSAEGAELASVPLTITAGSRSFVDDEALDVQEMMDYLAAYKGRSTTACPGPGDWLAAFGEAEEVACVTITSGLSGACNAARIAAEDYERLHPDRRVLVVDTRSTGPEMELVVEHLRLLHAQGHTLNEMAEEIALYRKSTHLVFALQSMRSLVNNGRVSPAVAALAGLMNIRVVGIASEEGTLQPVRKCRGDKRTLEGLLSVMEGHGYAGGRVRIAHCNNPEAAQALTDGIHARFPEAEVSVRLTRGLCSYYAEQGGILIGYEG